MGNFYYYYHNFLGVIFQARPILCNLPFQYHLMLINNPNFPVNDILYV